MPGSPNHTYSAERVVAVYHPHRLRTPLYDLIPATPVQELGGWIGHLQRTRTPYVVSVWSDEPSGARLATVWVRYEGGGIVRPVPECVRRVLVMGADSA